MRRIGVLLTLLAALGCSGDDPPDAAPSSLTTTTTTTTQPAEGTSVTLILGHCFIEPVVIGGTEWAQRMEQPGDVAIGTGGPSPDGFTGTGRFVIVSETEARFVDKAGLEVPFVPSDGAPPGICR